MLSPRQLSDLKRDPLAPDEPNRLRAARQALKLTQVDVESKTGIPQARISAIERGGYSQLPIETARAFATLYGCAIEDLFPAREAIAS